MFLKSTSGERFRVLLNGEYGAFLISYDEPQKPMLVTTGALEQFERIETPGEYCEAIQSQRSEAEEKRVRMIKPMLDDTNCLIDAAYRIDVAKKIAKQENLTVRGICNLYYRFLATGRCLKPKHRECKKNPSFDAAIQKYYFSAKRNSLRTAYELMLMDSYRSEDGSLQQNIPSFSCFQSYYYRFWANNPQKVISRDGLGNYLRNERPLYGSAMAYRMKIGSYCIDETPADLYLVSGADRAKTIGRPNIYLAVDIATQMITGVYVGMESGEEALMACVANAVADKVQFCAEFGIEIDRADWPCSGMPSEIISDRGGEFYSDRMEELCLCYGVDLNRNAPFRPDLKPLVERNIGLVQQSYQSMLEGCGVIGSDVYERWAKDYRKQAVLTLEEYRKIVIRCILAINNRTLEDVGHLPSYLPHTPRTLWLWMQETKKSTLLQVDAEAVRVLSLPRKLVKLERRGICFNKLRYVPTKDCKIPIGEKALIGYDPENSSRIYVFDKKKQYEVFTLAEASSCYANLSVLDIECLKENEREDRKKSKRIETEQRVEMRHEIQAIVEQAKQERKRYL